MVIYLKTETELPAWWTKVFTTDARPNGGLLAHRPKRRARIPHSFRHGELTVHLIVVGDYSQWISIHRGESQRIEKLTPRQAKELVWKLLNGKA